MWKMERPRELLRAVKTRAFARKLDALLSPEPWCIDNATYEGDLFEITGWALAPKGQHQGLTFHLNDGEFQRNEFPLPRQKVADIFWYKAGAARNAFRCRSRVARDELFRHGEATLTCVSRRTGRPLREEYNWYYPDDLGAPGLPDEGRRRRVSGNESAANFRLQGYTIFRKLDLTLRKIFHRRLEDFPRVLDWGCGCGRVARYFQKLPAIKLTGVDIDQDNLRWCREHLAFAEFHPSPLRPPLALAPASFDLLIGISVFSHLQERDQVAWLTELDRLASPGAVLLCSVLGESAAGWARWGRELWDAWHRTGFFAVDENEDLQGYIEEASYYVNTYLTRAYIRRHWSRFFEVVAIIPAYIGNQQDIVVMRKRR